MEGRVLPDVRLVSPRGFCCAECGVNSLWSEVEDRDWNWYVF